MKITQTYTPEQQAHIDELRAMTPAQWESICKGCGACCIRKMNVGGGMVLYSDLCCNYLNCATQRCGIYNNRFKLRGNRCGKVDLPRVLAGQDVPASCGYVEYIFGPAKFPARVDWAKITPIKDKVYDKMSETELMFHILPESIRWNQR